MSNTPETDAEMTHWNQKNVEADIVGADFAKGLEVRLAKAERELAELRKAFAMAERSEQIAQQERDAALAHLAEARARVLVLKRALDTAMSEIKRLHTECQRLVFGEPDELNAASGRGDGT